MREGWREGWSEGERGEKEYREGENTIHMTFWNNPYNPYEICKIAKSIITNCAMPLSNACKSPNRSRDGVPACK